MKSRQGIFADIASEAKLYGESQKKLYKLKGAKIASKAGAIVVTAIAIIVLALLTLIFASLALAEVFTLIWGYAWAGYLSVTFIYVIFIIIMISLMKKGYIQNMILRQTFHEEPHIRNAADIDKEINRLKEETKARENAFKESFINPTKYIIPLKLLSWIIKTFLRK